jgi:RNA polymerase sigma factor (sigma-70 family)
LSVGTDDTVRQEAGVDREASVPADREASVSAGREASVRADREASVSADAGTRREELHALAVAFRPELHRYCSRLMGSVIDGEDVVQDTLARALVALDELSEVPQLRSWLFRTAHNRALDVLRSQAVRIAEPIEAAVEIVDEAQPDRVELLMRQEAVQTAVSRFADLPIVQRSVVILKDVLDEPLTEIAGLLQMSVDAVKGHLARGRAQLRELNTVANTRASTRPPSAAVSRYIALFNQQDWDALRTLLADDVKLQQSAHPLRNGAQNVGMFFTTYAKYDEVWLRPAWLEGREVVAVFEHRNDPKPSYLMWLEWRGGRISFIRDYRYVRYIVDEAELVLGAEV